MQGIKNMLRPLILSLGMLVCCFLYAENTPVKPVKHYQLLVIYDEHCPVCHRWFVEVYPGVDAAIQKSKGDKFSLVLMNWSLPASASTIQEWYKENKATARNEFEYYKNKT